MARKKTSTPNPRFASNALVSDTSQADPAAVLKRMPAFSAQFRCKPQRGNSQWSRKITVPMGINTNRVKLTCFVLSGALASFAGITLFSQLRDISPTAGEGYELYAIAAAVIGGTSLRGGEGTILGTLLGAILIGVVQSGLVHAGVDSYWFRTFVGFVLIVAVVINVRLKQFQTSMA